jgi:hypothetical protein
MSPARTALIASPYLRPAGGGKLLENGDVRPAAIARHRQHLDTLQAQIAEHVEIARIIDQRRVAGSEQIANDELERVAGALGQQDLARMGGDAESCRIRPIAAALRISGAL